jgi:virginiamycin A acetyltransferase
VLSPKNDCELHRSLLSPILLAACKLGIVRRLALKLALRLERGPFYTATAREIMIQHYGVNIGAYSYGECFVPTAFPAGVSIGRYVSVGPEVRVYLRNHPADRLSLHPFFYNHNLGFVKQDTIPMGELMIEHDAWIGARVIITPGCSRIGLGAVIGAGAVVTKNVPDFAVMVGNPAKLIRLRFSEEVCELLRASRWWERPLIECVRHLKHMVSPLGREPSLHPLLKDVARWE